MHSQNGYRYSPGYNEPIANITDHSPRFYGQNLIFQRCSITVVNFCKTYEKNEKNEKNKNISVVLINVLKGDINLTN